MNIHLNGIYYAKFCIKFVYSLRRNNTKLWTSLNFSLVLSVFHKPKVISKFASKRKTDWLSSSS